eukprot:14480105-Ditylum_brightwellii.AAC.1
MKLWTSTRKLGKLLGRWIESGYQLHHNWPAYYDYNTGHLTVGEYQSATRWHISNEPQLSRQMGK